MFYCFLTQNMQMVPVPAQAFGNFFEGDCYIVLNVSMAEFPWHINEGMWFIDAWLVCVQVLHMCFLICFSCLSPDKWEQGFRPDSWHPLLDWKHLLSGRARCSSHLHHPAGWVPGWESCPVQGGAGQWVTPIQELFQKWYHVSEKSSQHLN